MDEKVIPIGFEYEDKTINLIDFFNEVPNESIDTRFIDTSGNKIPQQYNGNKLNLFETNQSKENTIYFCSLFEYLEQKGLFEEILQCN